jgi:hypothetical protein
LEDVAENGNISQFGSYQSKGWLSIIFPLTRLLGYLYTLSVLYLWWFDFLEVFGQSGA